MKKRRRSAPRLSLALTLFVAACAVNPATGRREFSLIGEGQEIAMGSGFSTEAELNLSVLTGGLITKTFEGFMYLL